MPRDRAATAVRRTAIVCQVGGALLLVVTTVAAPWVRYQVNGDASAHSLDVGALGPVLVAIGLLVLLLAVVEVRVPARVAGALAAVAGAGGFVLTVLAAGGRMAHANDLTFGGGATAWALGAALGLLATGTIVVGAVLGLLAPTDA